MPPSKGPAGESGRGFAVVADEVRKLAGTHRQLDAGDLRDGQRGAGETERVVAMITGVTSQVHRASSSPPTRQRARNHRQEARTTQAVNDIADATREQSAASQEVACGVGRIATSWSSRTSRPPARPTNRPPPRTSGRPAAEQGLPFPHLSPTPAPGLHQGASVLQARQAKDVLKSSFDSNPTRIAMFSKQNTLAKGRP